MNSAKKYHIYFGISILIYIVLNLLIPLDEASLKQYDLTQLQGKLLSLTITIPLILIWIVAYYGFVKFKAYADFIKESEDGKALNTLANGLGILALSLPLTSIISSIMNYLVRLNPEYKPWTTLINNYFAAFVALIVFISVYKGAEKLKKFVGSELQQRQKYLTFAAAGIVAAVFSFFVIQNPLGLTTVSSDGTLSYTPFGLFLALFRLILFIIAWYFGFISTLYINIYKQKIPGILYKKSLRLLSSGILLIIIGSIITQAFTFVGTRLQGAGLGVILAIVYILLAFIAVGYIVVALGAKKLKKLEEI